MSFFAIPTLAGQSAIAAAIAGEAPLVLSEMAVGDGNDAPTTPLETQTGLVNERARVPVQSMVRDGTKVTISAIVDENTGGFTIREAGIFDEDGQLLFVANIPETEKQTLLEGSYDHLSLGMTIVVSDTAQITINVDDASWATIEYVNQQIEQRRSHIGTPLRPYFLAVKSATQAAPPLAPSPGDTYLVPVDATGAWANQTGKVTQYRNVNVGWVFVDFPNQSMIGVEATGDYLKKTANGWRSVFASEDETKLGTSTSLMVHPAGLKAAVNHLTPPFANIAETIAGASETRKTHPKGVKAAIEAALANFTPTAPSIASVGSVIFAYGPENSLAGAVVAGSSLRYSNASGGYAGSGGSPASELNSPMVGSWRCHGSTAGGGEAGSTCWMRVL